MFGAAKRRIYLDYASATPVCREARAAAEAAARAFANPGSIHADGVEAKRLLEEARGRVARELGAKTRQVVFTAGLTESIGLAILGFARKRSLAGALTGTHWITTEIEHAAVLEAFADVERQGGAVTHLSPDARGLITEDALAQAIRPQTVFISIGWANNETGIVQDIASLARRARAASRVRPAPLVFHTDAGQAPLYRAPQVHTLGVDLLSLGGGKLYGPRAAGALFAADPSVLAPIILGGGQEAGLRAGTEDVVSAAGFAAALDMLARERVQEGKRLRGLRDELAAELAARIPGLMINGSLAHALPHLLNVSIPGISAEYLVLALDREGFALSTRSACKAGEARSHVVSALGGPGWRGANTLRISLGRDTSRAAIRRFAAALPSLVAAAGSEK